MNLDLSKKPSYHARVLALDAISPDTRRLRVEMESHQKFPYQAGQYAELSVDGIEGRAFSIASSPHEDMIEFHIKNGGQGISAHIVEQLKQGAFINITGPFGHSYWRGTNTPTLLLAGGVGVAPMKAIIDAALYVGGDYPLYLYWGARFENQLYMHDYFNLLEQHHSRFHYIPVISDEDNTAHRKGFATDALLSDFKALSNTHIYLAGPKAMCDAALPLLLAKNAEKDCIFSDSFTL